MSAKKELKKERLVNNQRRRTFLTWTRVVRYGLRNFTRNAWLTVAATVVMTITLLIILVTAVASSVLGETITSQKDKMELSFYIRYDADEDVLRNLTGKLRIQPNVQSVDISTSEEEYKKASKDNAEAWSEVVSQGITPTLASVIHVKLDDMEQRDVIENFVDKDPQFQEWYMKWTEAGGRFSSQKLCEEGTVAMIWAVILGGIVLMYIIVRQTWRARKEHRQGQKDKEPRQGEKGKREAPKEVEMEP